jgi:hypothetical protein
MFKPRLIDRLLLLFTAAAWTYACFLLGRFEDSAAFAPVSRGILVAALFGSPFWAVAVDPSSTKPLVSWLRVALVPLLLLLDLLAFIFLAHMHVDGFFLVGLVAAGMLTYVTVVVYRLHVSYGLPGKAALHG